MHHIINFIFTIYFITLFLVKLLVTSSLSLCVPMFQLSPLNPNLQGNTGVILLSGLFVIIRNNAGIMACPFSLSKDKIELQFATNHIGHFLLTNLLLDTIKKTSRESKKEGRIVNVSSEAHRFAYSEGICFDKINDESSYNNWRAYGQSKLANILHANELTRRLKEDGVDISANSLHPGTITTNLFRHNSAVNGLINVIGRLVLKNVQQGAATTCYVALHPQVKGISGKYFSDSNLAKTTAQGTDSDLAKKLWDFSMDLTK
ncbi:Short-chain dehydrogenase TIC 32, chloroplastic [Glycine max]|nr:Short-chain dehydrogenase TIC 32, chloroplastic [Glycine max]